MNISKNGLDLIKYYEKFMPTPYTCPAGKLTIGYGHVIREGETFTKISEGQAEILLLKDVQFAVNCLASCINDVISQNKVDALVSFIYNIGCTNFKSSMLLKYLNKRDFGAAADEFDKWIYANGVKLNGLIQRRFAEKQLFESIS
jgi:lysozyme